MEVIASSARSRAGRPDLDEFSVLIVMTLEVWCGDALTAVALRCDLLEQAAKRFALDGIGIPIPQTTVILKDDRGFNRQAEEPRTKEANQHIQS